MSPAGIALLLSLAGGDAPQPADSETLARLHRVLAAVREKAGLNDLESSPELRRLAERRAADIAAAPAQRRLPHPVPLDDAVDDSPELAGRAITERVTVVPAAVSGLERARAAWDDPEDGAPALDDATIAFGLGAWLTADRELVLVALFEAAVPIADREALERLIVDEINGVRADHGLVALTPNEALREVARAHSETMAREGLMGHRAPDGSMPADRMRAAGIGFRLSGENVARSLRGLGSTRGVIEGWMASPGHRRNILTPDFRETAIGIAVAADGAVYVTQLFIEP